MYGFRNVTKVMREKSGELDMEIHFKDAFRAFSKDDEGEDPKYHYVLRFVNISFKEIIYDNSKTIDMAGYISRIIDISIYIQCTSRLHPGRGTQICYDQSPRGGFLIIITIIITIIVIIIIVNTGSGDAGTLSHVIML